MHKTSRQPDRESADLPAPGQGKCKQCGHYAMIHGGNNCHHVAEYEGDGPPPLSAYCDCKGFKASRSHDRTTRFGLPFVTVCEQARRMTSQKRSFMGGIYRAYRAFFEPLHREDLPLSSNGVNVMPTQTCRITGSVSNSFWPDRLAISDAGTEGGAADWIVNNIKIAGRSQFLRSGDAPGDMFAEDAGKAFIHFERAKTGTQVEIVVTYIGTNKEGCPFYASITGMEYDPGLLDIVREAISQKLAWASRGLDTRPSRVRERGARITACTA